MMIGAGGIHSYRKTQSHCGFVDVEGDTCISPHVAWFQWKLSKKRGAMGGGSDFGLCTSSCVGRLYLCEGKKTMRDKPKQMS